jgi:hypothetical protein
MMVQDRVPAVVWFAVVGSAIWLSVALFKGQGFVPTLWGWWLMFQYPFVGLFAYLQPQWPKNFCRILIGGGIGMLGLEFLVQAAQYLDGEVPGDNLAGTFGWHGTGNLVLFILLVLSLALGRWIGERRWKEMLLVTILAAISSVLAETKLFMAGGLLLGLLGAGFYAFRYQKVLCLVPYLLLLGIMIPALVRVYDDWVPGAQRQPLERFFLEPNALSTYLNFRERHVSNGMYYYDIGRDAAVELAWEAVRGDAITTLWGMGLGARGDSVTLGSAGLGLSQGLGVVTSTSLLVMLQELGLGGLFLLACLYIWLVVRLVSDIRADLEPDAVSLRWGLLLFSLLWPLWLWYNTAWTLRVPMLLYWVALGYVFSRADLNKAGRERPKASVSRNASGVK